MAPQANRQGGTVGRNFALGTAGFAAFVALMAVFETLGVPFGVIGFLMTVVPLLVYGLIGIGARTLQVVEFFAAGRRVRAVPGGMAAAANWMGSAVLLGLAGALFFDGFGGIALLVGWCGGFVLVAVLFAPYFRKYGAFTVPDFLAARFGSRLARLAGVIVLLVSSAALMTAELHAGALVVARLLGSDFETGMAVALAVVLLCVVFGGMKSVTWSQVAQYIVLAAALLLPVALLSAAMTGNPLAPLAVGELLVRIGEVGAGPAGAAAPVAVEGMRPVLADTATGLSGGGATAFAAATLCLAMGAASLPHVLMRSFATTSVGGARRASGWAVLFIGLMFAVLPAAALLAKAAVLEGALGRGLTQMPAWLAALSDQGLARIIDANVDGRLGAGELYLDPDAVLLVLPEIGGLPFTVTALLAAGILAAALSTASGLLHATASAFSHDIYYRLVDRTASTAKRLVVARLAILLVAGGAAWTAINLEMDILPLVGWTFSLAAAGHFPVLVLAIWWRRCTGWGAVAGMLSGLAATLGYLVAVRFYGLAPVAGIGEYAAGLPGAAIGFVMAIGVSLATRAPSAELQAFIDDIRTPRGQSIMERERAAERIREAGSAR